MKLKQGKAVLWARRHTNFGVFFTEVKQCVLGLDHRQLGMLRAFNTDLGETVSLKSTWSDIEDP